MSKYSLLIALTAATLAAGCKPSSNLIEKITFTPSGNLETVRASLVFSNNVNLSFNKGFSLKNYGYVFTNPRTSSSAFEVGLYLNTTIVNDTGYAALTPTAVLPNGVALGVPYPLVEVRGTTPVDPRYDLMGYVDVTHQSWLGAGMVLTALGDSSFPEGLTLTQVFMKDSNGLPTLMGSVFGPVHNSDGSLKTATGIVVFANFRELLKSGVINSDHEVSIQPEAGVMATGQNAEYYRDNYDRLEQVEQTLIEGISRVK